jgi:DNA-binding XRE family transcriptional regulator
MSQDDLAAQVGVSRETIYKYEHDMADPRLLIFVCIADALGVTMDFLVRGDLSEI